MEIGTFLSVTFRALISLFTLFIVTKIVGKKQVSELSLFDYVIGISIGNFAAEMTINLESNEVHGIWAVILFGLVAYLVSWLALKSVPLRRFVMGTPTIIIQDGKILKNNMKKVRLDINELLEECRIKGYFDISQINYGIMEVNGEMSFLPKAEYKNLTPKDLNIKVQEDSLFANVIIDGKIMFNNLKLMNKDKEWLIKTIKQNGVDNIKNVLLCTLDSNDKVIIYKNNILDKSLDILE
jgi:uncharacterized membrane protein YcaP (DUF421 family)